MTFMQEPNLPWNFKLCYDSKISCHNLDTDLSHPGNYTFLLVGTRKVSPGNQLVMIQLPKASNTISNTLNALNIFLHEAVRPLKNTNLEEILEARPQGRLKDINVCVGSSFKKLQSLEGISDLMYVLIGSLTASLQWLFSTHKCRCLQRRKGETIFSVVGKIA